MRSQEFDARPRPSSIGSLMWDPSFVREMASGSVVDHPPALASGQTAKRWQRFARSVEARSGWRLPWSSPDPLPR